MINYTVDGMFLIDIVMIFNSAIYDEDYEIIDDRCTITKNYLTGWFIIDFVPILPFELMFKSNGEASNMVRISRMGRLYKILKLLKLIRLMKLGKQTNSTFFELVENMMQISS